MMADWECTQCEHTARSFRDLVSHFESKHPWIIEGYQYVQ